MANYYGTPAIVTDGLVFAVDAGNGQSYVSGSGNCFSLVSSDTGSIHNDVDFSSANQGSWVFDGCDCDIDCGDIAAFGGATELTLNGWIKIASPFVNDTIMAKWQAGSQACIIIQLDTSDIEELKVFVASGLTDGGSNYTKTTDSNLVVDTWYFISVIYDGTEAAADRIKIYVNGTLKSTSVSGTIPTSLTSATSTFELGRLVGLGRYWDGNISNIHINNKALTASEILQNYNATKNRFI